MLFKDFFFSFKNIHVSLLEKTKYLNLLKLEFQFYISFLF